MDNPGTCTTRIAFAEDSDAIARIYNEGILEGNATFETRLRTASDISKWFDGMHPIVVTECAGAVTAFAATFTYRPRECYSGVAEFSVYVARDMRGKGLGRMTMKRLIEECGKAGFWKLVSRVFPENESSRIMLGKLGFREVGIYKKHGRIDGGFKDVIIVEHLIPVIQE